jgi:hypothetical protein
MPRNSMLLAPQPDMDLDAKLWAGQLYLTHTSEIVAKLLYKVFNSSYHAHSQLFLYEFFFFFMYFFFSHSGRYISSTISFYPILLSLYLSLFIPVQRVFTLKNILVPTHKTYTAIIFQPPFTFTLFIPVRSA